MNQTEAKQGSCAVYPLIGSWSEYIVTDIENGKIIAPLMLMTKMR